MNLRFREMIFAIDPVKTGSSDSPLIRELSKLFASMQDRWDKYVDTSDAVSCIQTYDNEQIDVSIQMDVDEFFNLLFDRLEGQISDVEDKTTFRSLYGGQLVQQIKSCECDHISERLEPFSAIQCEIKGKSNLEDSLRAYVEGEMMQGDNKYSCTSCNRHVDAIKRACLKDIPDHLIFNLKRFDFDITTMTRCKVNDEFRFPDSIDMAPYNVESLSNPERHARPDVFELVGILVHSGTAESGHYYSYIRERPTSRYAEDSWVQFNDIDVSTFDPKRIPDCCYGGIELTSTLQLPKSHNAYMLFYQRVSSITEFEDWYDNHDVSNPVRLPFNTMLGAEIDVCNQETIRSYCLQDPSHARFIRVMLERMHWSTDHNCSKDHHSEDNIIRDSLDYIQQISCRFKEMPEFEATCKLLQDCAQRCFNCASQVASFFADTDSAKAGVQRESVLRTTILRNQHTSVRRSFSTLLCDSLRTMRKGFKDAGTQQLVAKSRETQYRSIFASCLASLAEPWPELHKFGRAWNDYFDLLSRLTGMGQWEAGVVLQCGFLERIAEVVWADVRHDPQELRVKYASYLNMKEKGRFYGLAGLIALLSTILEYVEFRLKSGPDEIRKPNREGYYELTPYEVELLCPIKMPSKQKPSLDWLRKITLTRQNPNAILKIVSSLVQEPGLASAVETTLVGGLAADTVGDAVTFLDAAINFCKYCQNAGLIQHLVKEALGGIDSIGCTGGREHLDFVIELTDVENESAGLGKKDFFTMVFRSAKSWAPALLIYPDELHYDVRGDTLNFLRERLFEPLEAQELDPEEEEVLTKYARGLARGCMNHIQQNHLPRSGKDITRVEVGQASQISRVLQHICDHYYGGGDAADDQFVGEAQATLENLQAFAQEAADAVSEDWPDNDSAPPSDSDNPDLQDWTET
jgi:ubiquitin carboxyl-terminal hydrolase 34